MIGGKQSARNSVSMLSLAGRFALIWAPEIPGRTRNRTWTSFGSIRLALRGSSTTLAMVGAAALILSTDCSWSERFKCSEIAFSENSTIAVLIAPASNRGRL